jgi:hypothetical protein
VISQRGLGVYLLARISGTVGNVEDDADEGVAISGLAAWILCGVVVRAESGDL